MTCKWSLRGKYDGNDGSSHFFLFLAIEEVLLMESSKVYHKASSILQLSILSRLASITDEGLESLSQGLRRLAALHIITLNFYL